MHSKVMKSVMENTAVNKPRIEQAGEDMREIWKHLMASTTHDLFIEMLLAKTSLATTTAKSRQ